MKKSAAAPEIATFPSKSGRPNNAGLQPKRGFASRPDAPTTVRMAISPRLNIDVTRGRITVVAFRRGLTVADMLRALLACEFPGTAP